VGGIGIGWGGEGIKWHQDILFPCVPHLYHQCFISSALFIIIVQNAPLCSYSDKHSCFPSFCSTASFITGPYCFRLFSAPLIQSELVFPNFLISLA
jgi:hypothetical protein